MGLGEEPGGAGKELFNMRAGGRVPCATQPTFFFFTGLRILMIHFSLFLVLTPSKTSLYLPRPTLRTTS